MIDANQLWTLDEAVPRLKLLEEYDLVWIEVGGGFSCREQIKLTTDRQALPLVQVIQMAMREGKPM